MRSATLDLIARANGRKTGDEMIAETTAKERAEVEELKRSGRWMNSAERRRWRVMMKKMEEMDDTPPNVRINGQPEAVPLNEGLCQTIEAEKE